MARVTVTELKNRLSEYLRRVKSGEVLEVVEWEIAIARIEAIAPTTPDAWLERLVRDGLATAPRQAPTLDYLRPPVACSGDAVLAVMTERGDR